ncbi:MAG: type II toxin-antitoxin system PemK/MazF family toxin [Defluviitaleaceae bacterium]|nr:type II toxin-antitoxin system PemK/MazF family toxin [Defluviitaleaceae bacterium]
MSELQNSLNVAKDTLDKYYDINKHIDFTGQKNTPKDYLDWVDKKTKIIMNSPNFKPYSKEEIKRGDVVWIEFGYNIGEEFSGRHPALVLKNGGKTLITIPITSKMPTPKQLQNKIYVELGKIYNFKEMRRWVNIFNITPISIKRVDKNKIKGNVKGVDLDNISKAFVESDLFKYRESKTVDKISNKK